MMEEDTKSGSKKNDSVLDQLKDIQDRLSRLEHTVEKISSSNIQSKTTDLNQVSDGELPFHPQKNGNEQLETRIGEYGMAWLGNFVLLFGIIFIIQLLENNGLRILSIFTGIITITGAYLLGNRLKENFPVISTLFYYTGHIILFYVAMKLHFFSSDPLLKSSSSGIIPALLTVIGLGYYSYRNRSQILAGIVLVMAMVLAIFTNSTHMMLALMLFVAATSLVVSVRLRWWTILTLSIIAVYLIYLLWLLGNPFINKGIEGVSEHQNSIYYLFAYAFVYSMLALWRSGKSISEEIVNSTTIINGLGFTLTTSLAILTFYEAEYTLILGLISGFCIIYAFILRWRADWKLPAALYALYGFAVLSVTVSIIYKFPLAFLLLFIQSLLVVAMALWFKSRFIVIMNLILFIGLLIAYLFAFDSIHSVNFSFAFVALISARIINWKKGLLEIQTEFIRNVYLISGFIMTLVSLYKAVPDKYITLSWTLAALLFFVMSLILSNIKYRWLAISTMVLSAIHLFLFDLKNVSIGLRIIALLFLAILSLGISIFYAKKVGIKKSDSE